MSQINRVYGEKEKFKKDSLSGAEVEVVRNPESGFNYLSKTLLISTESGAIFLSLETMKEMIAWAEKGEDNAFSIRES